MKYAAFTTSNRVRASSPVGELQAIQFNPAEAELRVQVSCGASIDPMPAADSCLGVRRVPIIVLLPQSVVADKQRVVVGDTDPLNAIVSTVD